VGIGGGGGACAVFPLLSEGGAFRFFMALFGGGSASLGTLGDLGSFFDLSFSFSLDFPFFLSFFSFAFPRLDLDCDPEWVEGDSINAWSCSALGYTPSLAGGGGGGGGMGYQSQ
jgi:hypothetical protein